ncbi:hypothetical protein ALQ87_01093 [Pseudomonas savastanoi pv. glycinea]|nr:hypothetical protein ALQ87_01093 [Pseudomonas savastanoi pv. glycinea]
MMRDETHKEHNADQAHDNHDPHGTHDFWSEASGNQDALNECFRFMASEESVSGTNHTDEDNSADVLAASHNAPQEAVPEVLLVLGEPGCGATALGLCLARKLRTAGRKVLEMDKISALEPFSFKANLDAALKIPPGIGNTPGSSASGLSALQIAVLEARNYGCFITHDADIYGTGDTAQDDNAALIIQLMRISRRGRFVIFGAAARMGWLVHSLQRYSLRYREVRLDPMPASAKFGQFITSVALRLLPPCPPDRIESLDVDAVYAQSSGRVGSAVTALLHQIMEKASTTSHRDGQQLMMWTADEVGFPSHQEDDRPLLQPQKGRKAASQKVVSQDRQAAGRVALQTEGQGIEGHTSELNGKRGEESHSERLMVARQELERHDLERPEIVFCHHLPAVENESFSSWIARQTQTLSHSIGHHVGDYLVSHCSKGGADPDMQWDNLEILESLSPMDRRFVGEHFSSGRRENNLACLNGTVGDILVSNPNPNPGNSSDTNGSRSSLALVPYSKALNYCPECFKADVAAGSAPALRLDWRRPRFSVCTRHDAPVLLEQMATSTFNILDKAWKAFAEHADSPASRLTTQFPVQHSSSSQAKADSARLAGLAARVQTWFFSLTPETSPSALAAELLMSYWLQDPNSSGAQGFARSYFFYRLSRPQAATKRQLGDTSPELVPDSAGPRDVAVAYWMLGIGFGVIDTVEAKFIHDTARPYSLPFPMSREEVGSLGGLAYSRGQRHAYLEYAKSTLSDSDFQRVAWALEYEGRPYRGRNRSGLTASEE